MQLEISHFVTTLRWVKHVHLCPEANKSVLNSVCMCLSVSEVYEEVLNLALYFPGSVFHLRQK